MGVEHDESTLENLPTEKPFRYISIKSRKV